jgi:ribosomal protein L12E/L44/L45/RPP1/RPP2
MLLAKNVLNLLDRKEIDESMVRGILEVVVHELEGMQMKELIQAMEQING